MRYKHTKHAGLIRGFSLFEMAVVVGVIGLVTGGIWVTVAQVRRSEQINLAAQELTTIVQNIRAVTSSQGTTLRYTTGVVGALTSALNRMRVFPAEMTVTGDYARVYNPFSRGATAGAGLGSVLVQKDNCNGNTSDYNVPCFSVEFFGLPQWACVQLLTITSEKTSTGLMQIRVSGQVPIGMWDNNGSWSLPISASRAVGARGCNPAIADASRSIKWIYSLNN